MQPFIDVPDGKEVPTAHELGLVDSVTASSIYHPNHATESTLPGADIVTAPPDVADSTFDHPETDQRLASFPGDWGSQESPMPEND